MEKYLSSNGTLLHKGTLIAHGTGIPLQRVHKQTAYMVLNVTSDASDFPLVRIFTNDPVAPFDARASVTNTDTFIPQGFNALSKIYTKYCCMKTAIKWRVFRRPDDAWTGDHRTIFWCYNSSQTSGSFTTYDYKAAKENGFPIRSISTYVSTSGLTRKSARNGTRWHTHHVNTRKWIDNAASNDTMEKQSSALTDYTDASSHPNDSPVWTLSCGVRKGAVATFPALNTLQLAAAAHLMQLEVYLTYTLVFYQPIDLTT